MNRLRILITVIFLSIMGLMWQTLENSKAPEVASTPVTSAKPDFVAVNLTRTVYDANGNKTQRLSAQKMTYYKAQDKAEFESPLLVLQSSENKASWRISSDSGILYNNHRLLLEQNVNAINLSVNDPIEQITGEHIRIDTEQSTMMSDHPVNLLGDGIKILGSGLTADLNQEKIELIKHAKTIYQRPSK